jgi:allophanate hydrolase subunit 2
MGTKTANEAMIDSAPAESAFAITPSDTVDLAHVTRGIYVGVTGDVKVDMVGGSTVTFVNLAGGVIHPLCVKRVYATGTTATNILGVY